MLYFTFIFRLSIFRLLEVMLYRFFSDTGISYSIYFLSVAYRGVVLGGLTPPPKFRRPSKIVPNSTRLWKLLKITKFRTPTPQDVRKKGSKILKLPSVRSCFTLAITNKLVVIINSLKVPKIKKILLYEMKFLVPNYSCLQNPWLGGYRPQIPVLSVLCPQLNLLNPPPPNKIPGYATAFRRRQALLTKPKLSRTTFVKSNT